MAGGGRTLGILFGNSKVMWPKFLEACRNDPALLEAAHPLDGYVKRAVSGAAESVVGSRCDSLFVRTLSGNDLLQPQFDEVLGLNFVPAANVSSSTGGTTSTKTWKGGQAMSPFRRLQRAWGSATWTRTATSASTPSTARGSRCVVSWDLDC